MAIIRSSIGSDVGAGRGVTADVVALVSVEENGWRSLSNEFGVSLDQGPSCMDGESLYRGYQRLLEGQVLHVEVREDGVHRQLQTCIAQFCSKFIEDLNLETTLTVQAQNLQEMLPKEMGFNLRPWYLQPAGYMAQCNCFWESRRYQQAVLLVLPVIHHRCPGIFCNRF